MPPFKITFTKELSVNNYNEELKSDILRFIQTEFINKKANNVIIKENSVVFKNILFKFENNWNIMVHIDKGSFTITNLTNNKIKIEYSVIIKKTLFFGAILGLFLFIISQNWILGVAGFIWLGVTNWLIAIFRHKFIIDQLIKKLGVFTFLLLPKQTILKKSITCITLNDNEVYRTR